MKRALIGNTEARMMSWNAHEAECSWQLPHCEHDIICCMLIFVYIVFATVFAGHIAPADPADSASDMVKYGYFMKF